MATIEEIKEERAFIHDIASPLMIAMGMVEDLQHNPDNDEKANRDLKLGKAANALSRISDMVKKRRAVLIEKTKQAEGADKL